MGWTFYVKVYVKTAFYHSVTCQRWRYLKYRWRIVTFSLLPLRNPWNNLVWIFHYWFRPRPVADRDVLFGSSHAPTAHHEKRSLALWRGKVNMTPASRLLCTENMFWWPIWLCSLSHFVPENTSPFHLRKSLNDTNDHLQAKIVQHDNSYYFQNYRMDSNKILQDQIMTTSSLRWCFHRSTYAFKKSKMI